ncbi:MAG: hypothetical protein WKF77_06035 [Planctomycetaceae bacterium]
MDVDAIELCKSCMPIEPVGPTSQNQRSLYLGTRRWRTPAQRTNPADDSLMAIAANQVNHVTFIDATQAGRAHVSAFDGALLRVNAKERTVDLVQVTGAGTLSFQSVG